MEAFHTITRIEASPGSGRLKRLVFNGVETPPGAKEYERIAGYLRKLSMLVDPSISAYDYTVETSNNYPTAAGLASSASGFAALSMALAKALAGEHSWAEEALGDPRKLSAIARLGSGSAARSVLSGGVVWWRGWDREGFDPVWGSHAEAVTDNVGDLMLVYVFLSRREKKVSSREGMRRSVYTSPLYWQWVEYEENGIGYDISLLAGGSRERLFERIMKHSDLFHAVARSSYPPIEYLTDESRSIIERVHNVNKDYGVIMAYTFDAGPNPVLVTTRDSLDIVKREVAAGLDYKVSEVRT